jgi:hypothetical protein
MFLITHRFTLNQIFDAYETFGHAARTRALKGNHRGLNPNGADPLGVPCKSDVQTQKSTGARHASRVREQSFQELLSSGQPRSAALLITCQIYDMSSSKNSQPSSQLL